MANLPLAPIPATPKAAPAPLKPLRGVRVLSLALNLPGPGALMRLRAMGATCTKAEPPAPKGMPAGTSGDPMGQYNKGAYATLHAGIKVISVDLKTDKGQAALHKALASHRRAADLVPPLGAGEARPGLESAAQAPPGAQPCGHRRRARRPCRGTRP